MKITLQDIEKRVNKKMRMLNLWNSKLTDNDIPLICRYLENNRQISKLNVSFSANITEEGAKLLASNKTINTLKLDRNIIGHVGAMALSVNKMIKDLSIANCSIGDEGAKALSANKTITALDVSGNEIGDDGAQALAANATITMLKISSNCIGAGGLKALAKNTAITSLTIRDNKIGVEGAKVLATSVTIKRLDIGFNAIGKEGAIALSANTSISSLNVVVNNIEDEGVKALVSNPSLQLLNIADNKISDECINILINALKANSNLNTLYHNFQDEQVIERIKKITDRNKILPWLLTIRYARLLAQAQRSENCLLGTVPVEVAGIINNYAVGADHYRFFMQQINKRPTESDFWKAKNLAHIWS